MGHNHTKTLREGDTAPGFTLNGSTGEGISLATYRGRSAVLVVFIRGTM